MTEYQKKIAHLAPFDEAIGMDVKRLNHYGQAVKLSRPHRQASEHYSEDDQCIEVF